MKNQIIIFGKSIKGKHRDNNQDSIYYFVKESGESIALLCDGMGGHFGGKEASNCVTQFIMKHFNDITLINKSESKINEWLKKTIELTQKALIKLSKKNNLLSDMGTTIVLVLFCKKKLFVYHAGDSRMYLTEPEKGRIRQITLDHNLENYSDYKYAVLNQRAIIHALGPGKFSKNQEISDAYQVIDTKDMKSFSVVLCSDGLYEVIDSDIIYEISSLKISTERKVQKLIDKAEELDSNDNISCVMMSFNL